MAEHRRPDGGLAQGCYCLNCGASGINIYATGHFNHQLPKGGKFICEANSELVRKLNEANKPDRTGTL